MSRSILTLIAALLLTIPLGCSSTGRASESVAASNTLQNSHDQVTKSIDLISKTIEQLDALSTTDTLADTFKQYTSTIKSITDASDKIKKRWNELELQSQQYVARWEQELATVQNPQVRAGMEERKKRVKDDYDKIIASAREAYDAYQPFINDLQEIQRALAFDLTPSGVASLQPAIIEAKNTGQNLNQKLQTLQQDLSNIMAGTVPSSSTTDPSLPDHSE